VPLHVDAGCHGRDVALALSTGSVVGRPLQIARGGIRVDVRREDAGLAAQNVPPTPDVGSLLIAFEIRPGAQRTHDAKVWCMQPGTYRLVKHITVAGGTPDGGPLNAMIASGPLVVVAR
jgi:hypothetical protein